MDVEDVLRTRGECARLCAMHNAVSGWVVAGRAPRRNDLGNQRSGSIAMSFPHARRAEAAWSLSY